MIIFKNDHTDPYFNLACEQYLLDTKDGDIFMLWKNEPSVIIGKNQNAYAELNLDFIKNNNIKVVRRLTGGGAVFHDLGNVNFTFITKESDCKALDFQRFTKPVIDALSHFGIEAELSGRNDIVVGGRKISGNAQCVYNGKIMHHGTLLFSANISNLAGALNPDPEKFQSKGIKSVRSRVANISELSDIDIDKFIDYLEKSLNGKITALSADDTKAINELAEQKYSTWDWNYGRSKEWSAVKKKRFDFGKLEAKIDASGGTITSIRLEGDYFGIKPVQELENKLVNVKLEYDSLIQALSDAKDYISGAEPELIADLILGSN